MFHARLCICHYIRLTSKSNPTRNTLWGPNFNFAARLMAVLTTAIVGIVSGRNLLSIQFIPSIIQWICKEQYESH
jgi:hypothetical protein